MTSPYGLYNDDDIAIKMRCEMNFRQFACLEQKILNVDLPSDLLNTDYFLKLKRLATADEQKSISVLLTNSWNTENVLRMNSILLSNTSGAFCMQWAFPQAYYAVFNNILALNKAIGNTETSHTAVLKKYSKMICNNILPKGIAICCDGPKDRWNYMGVAKPLKQKGPQMIPMDLTREDYLDHYVATFLHATRRERLKDKAPSLRLKTKAGTLKKKFSTEDWEKISNKLGATSIVDFFYRKRIKGNYKDIEIYNSVHFRGSSILQSLITVIDRLNFVHECYIAKVIGHEKFTGLVTSYCKKVESQHLSSRCSIIANVIAGTC